MFEWRSLEDINDLLQIWSGLTRLGSDLAGSKCGFGNVHIQMVNKSTTLRRCVCTMVARLWSKVEIEMG